MTGKYWCDKVRQEYRMRIKGRWWRKKERKGGLGRSVWGKNCLRVKEKRGRRGRIYRHKKVCIEFVWRDVI